MARPLVGTPVISLQTLASGTLRVQHLGDKWTDGAVPYGETRDQALRLKSD